MLISSFRALFIALLIALPWGCAEDTSPQADRAIAPPADSGTADRGESPADRGSAADKALVTLPDGGDGGNGSPCTGDCAQQTLLITFGASAALLERSVYGIDLDQAGHPGLYIEALHGGFSGCPQQDSPTPDRTLIISGLPLPQAGLSVTLEDGLVISLLDYQGTLLPDAVLSKATAATVSFVAADVCPNCTNQPEPSDPDGFVALQLEATFPEGTVAGHLYATHCDSLDL